MEQLCFERVLINQLTFFFIFRHLVSTELAVRDVLMQELMSLEPVAFTNVDVDIDTLSIRRMYTF